MNPEVTALEGNFGAEEPMGSEKSHEKIMFKDEHPRAIKHLKFTETLAEERLVLNM